MRTLIFRRLMIFVAVAAVIAAVFVGLAARRARQERLDRQLMASILAGHEANALARLAQGADPNARPIHGEPVSWARMTLCRLLRRPVPETEYGAPVLMTAIENGEAKVAAALLARGAKPNVCDDEGRTPLVLAVQGDDLKMTSLLLDHHADPNLWNPNPNATWLTGSPLSLSLSSEHVTPMTKLLLSHGANPNAVEEDGTPVLFETLRSSGVSLERMKLFLHYGADINASDVKGQTLLLNDLRFFGEDPYPPQIEEEFFDHVKTLISFGARADVQAKNGETPLIVLAQADPQGGGEPILCQVAQYLIAHGADPRKADRSGRTAAQWARQSHMPRLAALLARAARTGKP